MLNKVPTCLVLLPILLADVMFCSRCTMGDETHPEDVFLGQGRGFGNDPADFQTDEISGRDEEERLWRVFEQEARRVCGGFGGICSLGCSGHGRCLEEVGGCLCDADWFGSECSEHYSTTSSYLPPLWNDTSPSLCLASLLWGWRAPALHAELDSLQDARCLQAASPLVLNPAGLALGGQIQIISLALATAVNQGRPLVWHHPSWPYAKHPLCPPPGDQGCYFRGGLACPPAAGATESDTSHSDVQGFAHRNDVLEHTDTDALVGGLLVPARYGGAKRGRFWWQSVVTGWLMRPPRDLELKLRLTEASSGFRRPAVGLHIRRGDSCFHAAQAATRPTCLPVETYLPHVRHMLETYGMKHVHVATDDASVIELVRHHAAMWGATTSSLSFDREVLDSKWFIEHRVEAGALDAGIVAETAMLDSMLLAKSDAFVLTLASQMGRLALSSATARLGYTPPFVSVDGMAWGCCGWAGQGFNTRAE